MSVQQRVLAAVEYRSNDVGTGLESRLRQGASTLAVAASMAVLSTAAMAQCATTGTFANVAAFAPLVQGTTAASVASTVDLVNLGSLAQSSAYVGSPPNPQPDQQGAGTWSRVIGGTVETNSVSQTAGTVLNFNANVTFDFGVNCRNTTKQEFVGSQFGMDLARHNFAGGGHFHFGLTGGYFDVTTRDKTPGQSTFRGESQIPFAGIYAAIYAGNLSFDAQARWDFIQNTYNDAQSTLFNQKHDAQSVSFAWNAAYRFNLPQNWFVDVSGGGVYSRTQADDLHVAGTYATGNAAGSSPGILSFDDISSLLGRASVRVGTTITDGRFAWQPFVVGSVFHEFAGNITTRLRFDDDFVTPTGVNPGGVVPTFRGEATTSISRVGTYGHIGVGLAAAIPQSGMLGYARVDYRTGDNIDAWSVNAGFRYQFVPKGDLEAGLKDEKVAPAIAAHDWTGFYVGYNSGATFGTDDRHFAYGTTSPEFAGYLIGGQVGYNHQIGKLVLGVEADLGFSNAEGGKACPPTGDPAALLTPFHNCESKLNHLAIIAGRLGITQGRALIYAKAGIALAEMENGYRQNGNAGGVLGLQPDAKLTQSFTGWAAGAGMEFAFTDRMSAKIEYMYYDLGRERFATPVGFDSEVTGSTVRVGMNYNFGHRQSYEPLK